MKPAYATLRRRFLAAFIDTAFWLIAASLLFAPMPTDAGETVIALYAVVVFTLWFNYFAFCEWRWGQTIGKNSVGIEVLTDTGQRPGWRETTMRNLLRLVDVPFTLIGIGAWLWQRSPSKQRLGDRLARTVVVRRSSKSESAAGGAAEGSPPRGTPIPQRRGVAAATGPAAKAHGASRVGLPDGTWTPRHVLWGLLALIGLTLVEIVLVAPFDPDLSSLAAKLVAQTMLALTLVGVALGFATLPKSGFAPPSTLGLRRFKPSALKWAAAGVGAYLLFAAVYAPLVQPEQEDIARDLGLGGSVVGTIAAGILIIGAAPISEELFFRGFVFAGIRRRLSLWPAAAIAGLIFGVFHFTGVSSIGVVPQLAVLGLMLCWLYEKTGSLWPSILVHALNNAIAFIVISTT